MADIRSAKLLRALCRDVTALAEAELQRKLSASVANLRKGLSTARGLHASLRAEAAALEGFIPVIVEGARTGMQQALAKQVRQLLSSTTLHAQCADGADARLTE